ncbi:MAG: AgmX/PglI C-terminal domain-containing protein [Myxococcaceae bacterium]
MSKNLGMDVGTHGGDWLFKQGELVLGPVPATKLVEKLYEGEIDGRTEISRLGSGNFGRLAEVDFFKVHLAKAEAKKRVDHMAGAAEAAQRRRRLLRVAALATICVVAATGVAFLGQYLAVHGTWKTADDPFGDIEMMSPPTIALASARATEQEEFVYYPGGTPPKPSPSRPAPEPKEKPAKIAKLTRPPPSTKAPSGNVETDDDGLQMAKFDQSAINSVVASNQRSLYPCIRAEAERKPGLSAQIPIEFVIGNDGHVSKVWVDNPTFKEGSLPECLLRALQKWPFKAYEGERATVQLKFKVGKG